MAECHAWLLSLSPDIRIAVADREMIEYVLDPSTEHVPLTPDYCSEVLIHREEMIPLFDLNSLLGIEPLKHRRYVGVLAYQTRPRQPLQHLAVYLYGPPVRIQVSDDWVTESPALYKGVLGKLVMSCFSLKDLDVPIIDVPYLASTELMLGRIQESEENSDQPASPGSTG